MSVAEDYAQDLVDCEAREVVAGVLGSERALRVSAERIESMSDNGIVRVMRQAAAEIARLEAMQVRGTAALARRRGNARSTEAEVALALCLTPVFAGALVSAAESLVSRFPRTLELMERGKLSLFRAMKVTEATAWLSDDAARAADAALVTRLPGKDPTGVRKAATYAAGKADPEGSDRRSAESRASRALSLTHQESGTATLSLENAPVEKAVAAYARVDRMAKSLKTRDEPRTLDQLRADVALDLLLCAEGGGGEPRLEGFLYLGLDTYLGLNEDPVEFSGHGPIPAALARELLGGPDTVLRRIITDPITGQVHDLGRTRYRPTAAMAEFVQVRDRTCRRPGCNRPAQACEIDHTVDWQHGGETRTKSLAGFCGRDHALKDEPGWRYVLTDDGTLTITTPAGQHYRSTPPHPRQ